MQQPAAASSHGPGQAASPCLLPSSSLIFIQSAEKLTTSECSGENRPKSVKSTEEGLFSVAEAHPQSVQESRERPLRRARPHEAVLTAAEAGGARGRCWGGCGGRHPQTSGGPPRDRLGRGATNSIPKVHQFRVQIRFDVKFSASCAKKLPKFRHESLLFLLHIFIVNFRQQTITRGRQDPRLKHTHP